MSSIRPGVLTAVWSGSGRGAAVLHRSEWHRTALRFHQLILSQCLVLSLVLSQCLACSLLSVCSAVSSLLSYKRTRRRCCRPAGGTRSRPPGRPCPRPGGGGADRRPRPRRRRPAPAPQSRGGPAATGEDLCMCGCGCGGGGCLYSVDVMQTAEGTCLDIISSSKH